MHNDPYSLVIAASVYKNLMDNHTNVIQNEAEESKSLSHIGG